MRHCGMPTIPNNIHVHLYVIVYIIMKRGNRENENQYLIRSIENVKAEPKIIGRTLKNG